MSRHIKFRVWNPDKNAYDNRLTIRIYKDGWDCGYQDCGGDFTEEWGESDGYKLEQYTGVKDKNGKEICEGDIVKVKNPFGAEEEKVEVLFEEGVFGIQWKELTSSSTMLKLTAFDIEVIGNINESPELLKS